MCRQLAHARRRHRCRRHLPDRTGNIGLVGALLAEPHDEGAEGRRHLGPDVPARSRDNPAPDTTTTELALPELETAA